MSLAIVALLGAGLPGSVHAQAPACSTSVAAPSGEDFSGQDLSWKNFAHGDLRNANFAGATLTGTVFIRANLSGANFSNATVDDSKDATRPTDFSFANLTGACFKGASFNGLTYFTYATLTSADFSASKRLANAVFDPSLTFARDHLPRPAFRQVTLNCDFIDAWKDLDLTGADISACSKALAGRDLSGADMASVNFAGMDLAGVKLRGATLSGATFTRATLEGADLSGSHLYGATLANANLEGANLSRAFLTNNLPDFPAAANLAGAYLKNVNLANAQLSGADLSNASFYSSVAVGQATCATDVSPRNCASVSRATLNNTRFAGAYLYGVDFTEATIQGVDFANAVVIGSNFAGANLLVDSRIGTDVGFTGAFLQGANLAPATLSGTSLQSAFVDFRREGNILHLLLDGHHTNFPGWKKPGQSVCVVVGYAAPTTVPTRNSTLTCPDGGPAAPSGCGPTEAGNTRWNNGVDIAQVSPPGSYFFDATYTKKAADICDNPDPDW
jgi:uncharacterized protein YjbI with pentapeptide repeats